jgi:hypothetical protein
MREPQWLPAGRDLSQAFHAALEALLHPKSEFFHDHFYF